MMRARSATSAKIGEHHRGHSTAAALPPPVGNVNWNIAPSIEIRRRPEPAAVGLDGIEPQIASPIPIPCGLVVRENGVNSLMQIFVFQSRIPNLAPRPRCLAIHSSSVTNQQLSRAIGNFSLIASTAFINPD